MDITGHSLREWIAELFKILDPNKFVQFYIYLYDFNMIVII